MLKIRITYMGDEKGKAEAQQLVDHIYSKFECGYRSREYNQRGNSKYINQYFDFYIKEEDQSE